MFRYRLAVTMFVLSLCAAVRGADWTAYEPPPEGKARIVRAAEVTAVLRMVK